MDVFVVVVGVVATAVVVVVVVAGGVIFDKNDNFTKGSDLSPVTLANNSTFRKLCTEMAVIRHSKAVFLY